MLKTGQSKVTVEPNQTIQSEIDIKVRDFVLVGAESVDKINEKIKEVAQRIKQLEAQEKEEIEYIRSELKAKEKEVSKTYAEKAVTLTKQAEFLELQKKSAVV